MDEIERSIRRRFKEDFPYYAEKCLKIRAKEGKIMNFSFNNVQRNLHDTIEKQKRETGKVRLITVKGRQEGISTYTEGRFYWLCTHNHGVRAFILTHHKDATNNLFDMAKRFHENCPGVVRPSLAASNAKELIFESLDSGYKIGTAGTEGVGRSSTIQYLHGSEVAFWRNSFEHSKGIIQAVPNSPGTEIILESTANGTGNYFYTQWQLAESGQSEYIAKFIPWYWLSEYKQAVPEGFKSDEEEVNLIHLYGLNNEQLSWRRTKIAEMGRKGFMQEYPFNPTEAFQASGEDGFIDPMSVALARKAKVEGIGRLIIGVDSATSGNDRTAIIRRKGRKAYNLQTLIKKTPTEITNILHMIIINEQPDLLALDGSPAGGGAEIRDRLWQLGHHDVVRSFLGGQTPLDLLALPMIAVGLAAVALSFRAGHHTDVAPSVPAATRRRAS